MKPTIAVAIYTIPLLLMGCDDQTSSAPQKPQIPKHWYEYHKGNDYGYGVDLSKAQKDAGMITEPLNIYQYLGRRGDTFQITSQKSGVYLIAECTKPCDYMTAHAIDDIGVSSNVIALKAPSVGWEVFQDAIQGKLDRAVVEHQGKAMHLWFNDKFKPEYSEISPAK